MTLEERKQSQRGITLIEMLVVVVIMALFAAWSASICCARPIKPSARPRTRRSIPS